MALHDRATYQPCQDRIDPVGLGPGDESASTRSPSTPSTEPCARRRSASQHVLDEVAFVTAYEDRDTPAFKKTASVLAWRSFAWFMSERDHIVVLRWGSVARRGHLSELMMA